MYKSRHAFWSYLWGIETPFAFFAYFPVLVLFWSYLWGIETATPTRKQGSLLKRFDRTYEELKLPQISKNWYNVPVLIVPMRNWNIGAVNNLNQILLGFDRTYEELKHLSTVIQAAPENWRFDRTYEELKPRRYILGLWVLAEFWSYLWGIETCRMSCRTSWRRSFWSYLWGIETSLYAWRASLEFGVFWSYLWGIETRFLGFRMSCPPSSFWSYLWGIETRPSLRGCNAPWSRFDRTYEELKHETADTATEEIAAGFDRTYEELKHEIVECFLQLRGVLIVPMRNWNQPAFCDTYPSFSPFWSYLSRKLK